jgi:RND family efflux transporter MFP subunit
MTLRTIFTNVIGIAILCSGSSFTANAQVTVTGVIRAEQEVVIQSESAGVVDRVAVQEGQRVEENQLLAQLRNDRQKIALDLSRTGLAKANAMVEETRIILENAEKQASRIQIAADALPRKELEDIQDQIARLRANLNAQIADRARAEEEVRLREHELRVTQLFAPFAGTVTEVHVDRGDSLRPMESPVLKLVGLDQLFAEVLLPIRYIRTIRLDQSIRVEVETEWLGSQGRLNGRVLYINPTIDAASGTFKIKIGVPNPSGLVRPGMLAQVHVNP